MKTQALSYFDLNIGDILESWEPRHAVREIIANALDEQMLTDTADVLIAKADGAWTIRDHGRGLRVDHLKQNESEEKLANPSKVIGRFGVGLKDALATLHRRGILVKILSRYQDIGIEERAKHGFDQVPTLHAVISPPSDPKRHGTVVVLLGIDDQEIVAAKDFFLRFSKEEILGSTSYGQILKCHPSRSGRVYINGLRVAEEPLFAFSYNITSLTAAMRSALNRERTNVGRSAFSERVKSMLLACDATEVAEILAEEIGRLSAGTAHDEVKWLDVAVHACRILNQTKKVVFVSADEIERSPSAIDHARSDGYDLITLPRNIRDKIQGINDASGTPVRGLDEFTKQWAESFEFDFIDEAKLKVAERAVYSRRHDIAALAGGWPDNVAGVKVTNTMRPDEHGRADALGLWVPKHGQIVVRRDQLRSLEDFAGTLLHEITHASSGEGDVSREFESALTDLIGRLSVVALVTSPTERRRTAKTKATHAKIKSSRAKPVRNSPKKESRR